MSAGAPDQSLYVAALAREMHDRARVFAGAHQNDVALAAYLARRLWAPRLKLWANGMPQLDRTQDELRVGRGSYEGVLVTGRDSTFWQARAFDDALRAPLVFAGGLQVDARGNTNLAGIPGPDGGWRLRGPGSAGLSSLTALAERFFLGVPVHDRRCMVERCAVLSVLGDPVARARIGLKADALAAVITPLARFEPSEDGLVLTEVAPGCTPADVAVQTGFKLREAATVRERAPLSGDESAVLSELTAAAVKNISPSTGPSRAATNQTVGDLVR